MNEEEPFLKRWSRRKGEARDVRDAPAPVAQPGPDTSPNGDHASATEAQPAAPKSSPSEQTPERPLTEADFADVDFDALDFQSDYARFLTPGVPEAIKRKALQKLWASNPLFTTPDPFQDYQGDYTDAAVAVPAGTLKTSYRVGKGFLSDEEVAEWEALGKPVDEKTAATAVNGEAAKMPAGPVTLAPEPADQPEVHALLSQSDTYMAALYPAESNHMIDVATLGAPNARFVVARRDGAAVGCGALMLGADGEAEIKRMFVAPEARGLKVGRLILTALEEAGKADGVRVIRLETGLRQPEAIGLYRRHGYTERGPFGTYAPDPLSTFFEKWIA